VAYCATGQRWAVLDLERLIAEGRGDYRFVERARTEIRKLVGDLTMRPDGGVLVAEIDRASRCRSPADCRELERVRSAPKSASVETLLPRLPALIRAHVRNLGQLAAHEPVRAWAAVRQALDTDITIRPAEAGRHVVAEYGLMPLRIASGTKSESVVAGGRY